MKKPEAITGIILETRVLKKDGTHPVKLRVTFNRERKYYSTGISCTEDDFEKINAPKPRAEYKDQKIFLNSIEQKAIDIISEIENFTFAKFDKLYTTKKSDRGNVFSIFQDEINKLVAEGRIGTKTTYENALVSLKEYTKKDTLRFEDITIDWLKAFERWHINKGNSITTVGIYLRNLRTLFNNAIVAGDVKRELYPFHKRGYQIPSGRGRKMALKIADVGNLFNHAPASDSEAFNRDLWLFSYLCNGANIKDIALLKYKNLEYGMIVFVRAKTERTTKKDLKNITAVITEDVKAIIERWGNKPALPETYVFPILTPGLTPQRERDVIQLRTSYINKYIERIAKIYGIDKKVTTYTARHTFATVLKKSGASIEFISEAFAHSDTETTKAYMDSFEDDIKKEWAAKLTDFNT